MPPSLWPNERRLGANEGYRSVETHFEGVVGVVVHVVVVVRVVVVVHVVVVEIPTVPDEGANRGGASMHSWRWCSGRGGGGWLPRGWFSGPHLKNISRMADLSTLGSSVRREFMVEGPPWDPHSHRNRNTWIRP